MSQKMTSWDLLYNILRANFDGRFEEGYCQSVVSGTCDEKAEYLYGHTVTGIKKLDTSRIEISFKNRDSEEETIEADYVIAADGASSTVRQLLLPDVKRTYAGYVAWRGTVPEGKVPTNTLRTFKNKFIFYHSEALQILA